MNGDLAAVVGKPRVLFVCTGNTCRSVMAEYIARKKFGEHIEVASAGVFPGSTEDAQNAIFTLKSRFNIDASSHRPKDVRTIAIDTFDLVVAMDNQVATRVQNVFPSLRSERLENGRFRTPTVMISRSMSVARLL
jgi:protein arginine phosphatase